MLFSKTNVALVLAAATFSTSVVHGQVLVSEFQNNPKGSDDQREWVEIYNAGDAAVDLTNWKIGDAERDPNSINPETSLPFGPNTSSGEGMHLFPDGTIMQPGDVFVIARQAAPFQEYFSGVFGFDVKATFELFDTDPTVPQMGKYLSWATGDMFLANGGDSVFILDNNDSIVDGTNHGSETTFFDLGVAVGDGQSLERFPANVDTDTAADWVIRDEADMTPGFVSIPEPASLALLSVAGLGLLRRRNA